MLDDDEDDDLDEYVDFDETETRELLRTAPMRKTDDGPEIFVNGEWVGICRTDLLDEEATYDADVHDCDIETIRQHYLNEEIIFGARYIFAGAALAIIDSGTDG